MGQQYAIIYWEGIENTETKLPEKTLFKIDADIQKRDDALRRKFMGDAGYDLELIQVQDYSGSLGYFQVSDGDGETFMYAIPCEFPKE